MTGCRAGTPLFPGEVGQDGSGAVLRRAHDQFPGPLLGRGEGGLHAQQEGGYGRGQVQEAGRRVMRDVAMLDVRCVVLDIDIHRDD